MEETVNIMSTTVCHLHVIMMLPVLVHTQGTVVHVVWVSTYVRYNCICGVGKNLCRNAVVHMVWLIMYIHSVQLHM